MAAEDIAVRRCGNSLCFT